MQEARAELVDHRSEQAGLLLVRQAVAVVGGVEERGEIVQPVAVQELEPLAEVAVQQAAVVVADH